MHQFPTRFILVLCLVQLFSCQKQLEKNADDSLEFQTSSDAVVVSEIANCKLRTVTHESPNAPGTPNILIIGTFVYHPDGLPAELTYKNGNSGNPNYYFVYDNKRRLREMRIGFSRNEPGTGGPWHRYGYNNADQIIVDSMFNYSHGAQTVGTLRTTATFTYDSQKRIVKEVKNWYTDSNIDLVETLIYDYDSRGNLAVEGWASSSYDNNNSIFRAHPLFQFIHRNYSKNNAAPQAKYNAKGFPLSNNPTNDSFFNADPNNPAGSGITKATYDCDGYSQPNEFLYCKLRTVEYLGHSNAIFKGTFVYHPDGLPDNFNHGSSTGTGTPNYYFLYDNKRRLKELRIGYTKTDIVEAVWHKYGYNNYDQIVTDTLYNPGYTANGQTFPDKLRRISQLTYDSQNRIAKETVQNLDNGSSRTDVFAYDNRGNLIVSGWPLSSYDNNVSIFRSHSLFQFLHRNYSRNNSSVQGKYNSKGLPLSNDPMNDNFLNAEAGDFGSARIIKATYDCQ